MLVFRYMEEKSVLLKSSSGLVSELLPALPIAVCQVPRKKKSLQCCILEINPVPLKFFRRDFVSPS